MLKRCYVVRTKQNENLWSLPESILKHFGLRENDVVSLKCGGLSSSAKVGKMAKKSSDNISIMGLSDNLMKSLHIPDDICFPIKSEGPKRFSLGPVIGILTFPGHVPNRLGWYKAYAKLNAQNGLLYVFRGRGINLDEKTVHGYYYTPVENTWKLRELPYPDAVIDRCYPNPYVSHKLLEKVIGPGKIFNKKTMIDKIMFFRALKTNEFLKNHTPETKLFTNLSDIEKYLNKHQEVFLKPTNAMKGIGIVVVRREPKGTLQCLYTIKGQNFTKSVSSVKDIPAILETAAGRKRPYVIQQSIQRMEYKGGPFSIRTWAMKNGKGQWIIPGMFSKGSFGNGFLTNFTAGAKLIPLKELFDDIIPRLPYNQVELLSIIEKITLETAAVLDKTYGPLGELGFDIVFDLHGKPWVIEANGNPGTIPIFIQKEYPLWKHLVWQLPLEYATYLAGFQRD